MGIIPPTGRMLQQRHMRGFCGTIVPALRHRYPYLHPYKERIERMIEAYIEARIRAENPDSTT